MGKLPKGWMILFVMAMLTAACEREESPLESTGAEPEALADGESHVDDDVAGTEVAEPEVDDPPVRVDSWLVETAEGLAPGRVEQIASDVLQGEVEVEPLFPDSPDLQGMYIVYASRSYPELEARRIGYALLDRSEFTDAVPNYPSHEPDEERAATAACVFDDGSGAPEDHEWSLEKIRAFEAWQLSPPAGGKTQGEGVTICHPDSGYSLHVELDQDAVDKNLATDFVDSGGDGTDPLNYSGNVGHGTATGSVLVSRGGVAQQGDTDPPGGVHGVAPKARIIPIRAIKRVALFLDSDVARAVNHARTQQCDVLSMSLGGAGFFGLEKAIRRAVEDDNKIIVAAAGNCVGFVVAPAKYETTIAAAASNMMNEPWDGSSRGSAVTVTAPGEDVWVARRKKNDPTANLVEPADGTSYATAAIAAAAANWIAFHGKPRLDVARGSHTMNELFRWAVTQAVDAPPGWDAHRYGAGILDLEKLLQVDIDAFPEDQQRTVDQPPSALTTLARTIDRSPAQTRAVLAHLFGGQDPEAMADRYGAELERIATTQPAVIEEILDQVDQRAPRSAITEDLTEEFSPTMRAAVARP